MRTYNTTLKMNFVEGEREGRRLYDSRSTPAISTVLASALRSLRVLGTRGIPRGRTEPDFRCWELLGWVVAD
jgi:hypothetical protein